MVYGLGFNSVSDFFWDGMASLFIVNVFFRH